MWDRSAEAKHAQDPTTGCLGCASGKGAGPTNIFGNKYGQYLAAVQIAREERLAKIAQQKAAAAAASAQKDSDQDETDDDDNDDDDDETDNEEEGDDYGPTPAAGIWAGSQKLQQQAGQMILGGDNNDDDADGDAETEDEEEEEEDDEGPILPPAKRVRQE